MFPASIVVSSSCEADHRLAGIWCSCAHARAIVVSEGNSSLSAVQTPVMRAQNLFILLQFGVRRQVEAASGNRLEPGAAVQLLVPGEKTAAVSAPAAAGGLLRLGEGSSAEKAAARAAAAAADAVGGAHSASLAGPRFCLSQKGGSQEKSSQSCRRYYRIVRCFLQKVS